MDRFDPERMQASVNHLVAIKQLQHRFEAKVMSIFEVQLIA